tara:strand:- start:9090 stop:9371 length:282 start_codon:yes stop_codon:yes gene_type:complete
MRPTYRRFKELREKAQEKLKGPGVLEHQLTNAVCEIGYMDESEVPKHQWESIKSILNSCRTHKAEKEEGIFQASINKMTYEEKIKLKRAIELL